jgi:putative polymerase
MIIAIPVIGVTYNAILALLSAHGAPINNTLVVLTETSIILAALGLSAYAGMRRSDILPLLYLGFTAGLAIMMSIVAEAAFVEGLRNVLIISGFTLLGARANEKVVRLVFTLCSLVTLVVLLIEISSTEAYASLFRPADYLAKTRGYQIKEFYEETGLAIGTIAYRGRFSFGLFDGPRTSSIFLEQVNINIFAIVLMIYLTSLWAKLSWLERMLALVTIVTITVTNNARMAAIVAPIFIIGYFVFPKMPRYSSVLIPVILLGVTFILFQFERVRYGDDLVGRLATTYRALVNLSASDLLFGNRDLLARSGDTGYGFVIFSTTIFGALAYWAYLTLIIQRTGVTHRRTLWSASVYIYIWLLVGGTGSFSMKTAPLLWLLVGYVRVTSFEQETEGEPIARPRRLRRSLAIG